LTGWTEGKGEIKGVTGEERKTFLEGEREKRGRSIHGEGRRKRHNSLKKEEGRVVRRGSPRRVRRR